MLTIDWLESLLSDLYDWRDRFAPVALAEDAQAVESRIEEIEAKINQMIENL